jgi:hypothetical protein
MKRQIAMADVVVELVVGIMRAFIGRFAYALFLKMAAWLDPMVHGRTLRIVVGLLLGIGAYFLIPVMVGLLSL